MRFEQFIPLVSPIQSQRGWKDWVNPFAALQPYRIDANPEANFAWAKGDDATFVVQLVRRAYSWIEKGIPQNGSPSAITDRAELLGGRVQLNHVLLDDVPADVNVTARFQGKVFAQFDAVIEPRTGENLVQYGIGESMFTDVDLPKMSPAQLGPRVLIEGAIPVGYNRYGIELDLRVKRGVGGRGGDKWYGLSYIGFSARFVPAEDELRFSQLLTRDLDLSFSAIGYEAAPEDSIELDDNSGFVLFRGDGVEEPPCRFRPAVLWSRISRATIVVIEIELNTQAGYFDVLPAQRMLWDAGTFLGARREHPYEPVATVVRRSASRFVVVTEPVKWDFSAAQDSFYSVYHFDVIGENRRARIGWNHAPIRVRP